MKLTEKTKAHIDGLSYEHLRERVRQVWGTPIGDPWLQGETGKYWMERMLELRKQDEARHVAASKSIGWTR